MKARLLALIALAIFGLDLSPDAQAQSPRVQVSNPLMPNLGVPYTNPQMARAMMNRGRGRRRHRPNSNRLTIMRNVPRGIGSTVPF